MAQLKTKQSLYRLAGLLATVLFAAGCAEGYRQSSMVVASTDQAADIMSLYSVFTWISIIVFVIVEGLILYAVIRFRATGKETGNPEQVHGHTVGEIAWTIAPALIVLFITIPTIKTIFKLAEQPQGPDIVHVNVVGKQWWWEFDYPGYGVVTANELHLPVGKTASFRLQSTDVIHSFWFPNMGGKRDLTPGHTNHMYFTPAKEGVYLGQCAEFCGTSHANMRMTLVVHSQEDFDKWITEQRAQPAGVTSTEAPIAAGRDAFMANCAACHTIAGVADFGKFGPNLTHVASRSTIGSGLFTNNTENLSKWLHDPQGMKPGSKMVLAEKLNDETVDNLVAFLQSLK